jgi:hypothetical protein
MRQHFDEAIDPANESDDEVQRREQEMEVKAAEEEDSSGDESESKDEGHATHQGLFESQFV